MKWTKILICSAPLSLVCLGTGLGICCGCHKNPQPTPPQPTPNPPVKSLELETDISDIDFNDISTTVISGTVTANGFSISSLSLVNDVNFYDFNQTPTGFIVKLKDVIFNQNYALQVKDNTTGILSNTISIHITANPPTKFIEAKKDDNWTNFYLLFPSDKFWSLDPLSDSGIQTVNMIEFTGESQQKPSISFVSDQRSTQKTCTMKFSSIFIAQAATSDNHNNSSYYNDFKNLCSLVQYDNNNYYQYKLANTDTNYYKINDINFTSYDLEDNNFYENFLQYVLVSEVPYSNVIINHKIK